MGGSLLLREILPSPLGRVPPKGAGEVTSSVLASRGHLPQRGRLGARPGKAMDKE